MWPLRAPPWGQSQAASLWPCVHVELSTGHAVSETRGRPRASLSPCSPGWSVASLPVTVTVTPAPPPRTWTRSGLFALTEAHSRRGLTAPRKTPCAWVAWVGSVSCPLRGATSCGRRPVQGSCCPEIPLHVSRAHLRPAPAPGPPPRPRPSCPSPQSLLVRHAPAPWPCRFARGRVSREGSPAAGGLWGLASWTEQSAFTVRQCVCVCVCMLVYMR